MHNTKNHIVITIDGPAASGKSSIAKRLAQQLGFYYLYTGLLYRAVGYILAIDQYHGDIPLQKNFDIAIPQNLSFVKDIVYEYRHDKPHILYKGSDITDKLLHAALDQAASIVATNQSVRDALLAVQRKVAEHYNLIADGRDCGTVVFPFAAIKFYLTADVHARAQRVFNDHKRAYTAMTLAQIEEMLVERDERDKARAIAPLAVPKGAFVIDNSQLGLDQTLEACMQVIEQRLKKIL